MELLGWVVVGYLVAWLLFGRKKREKAKDASNAGIEEQPAYRVVGPDDYVVPSTLLNQLGRTVLDKEIAKIEARGAPRPPRGPVGGAEDEESSPERLEH